MPKEGESGQEEAHSACHIGSPETAYKELEVQGAPPTGTHLFSTAAHSLGLFCTWPFRETILHEFLTFLHILRAEALAAVIPNSLLGMFI